MARRALLALALAARGAAQCTPDPVMTDANIYQAVTLFFADRAASECEHGPIKDWVTTAVTSMRGLFCGRDENCGDPPVSYWNAGAAEFNEDLSGWDLSNCEDTSYMFENALLFNADISKWNTAKVRDFEHMFEEAETFDQPIGGWSTSLVENTDEMFYDAFAFNQDLSRWDMGSVTEALAMFEDATAFDQRLGWCLPSGQGWGEAFLGSACADVQCGALVDTDELLATPGGKERGCTWYGHKGSYCSTTASVQQACPYACGLCPAPTPAPTPACADAAGKVVKAPNGPSTPRNCNWVAKKAGQRCAAHVSARYNCPAACENCGCEDKAGDVVTDQGANYYDCAWVAEQAAARCAVGQTAAQNCKITCDTCSELP